MPYFLNTALQNIFGKNKFLSEDGHTECVAFVQAVTKAGNTKLWRPGFSVKHNYELIQFGTAIATFDESGKYPTDDKGKHAAIYLCLLPSLSGIRVLDQWNAQGEVKERVIIFNNPGSRSNNANYFHVIE